ncbi:MAG: hypothetical protein RL091_2416, partial [Verrucomicrobiota bacterium]
DAQKAQTTYIKGVAMIKVGKLVAGISNTATTFSIDLDIPAREVLIPRKDNTQVNPATGNLWAPGQYDIVFNVSSQYDSWLRIDNEWMQIISVGNPNGAGEVSVTVVRNYKGTGNVSHSANDNVFSPVYLGQNGGGQNPHFTQGYPDSSPDGASGSTIRYAMDPGRTEAVDYRVNIIDGFTSTATPIPPTTKRSYDGAWWDTFNQTFFNMCDARGNEVLPTGIWNFATGAVYSDLQFVTELRDFTVEVRAGLASRPLHPDPLPFALYANTYGVGISYHLSGPMGSESLVNRPTVTDPIDDALLDGGCFEYSFLEPDVAGYKPVVDTGADAQWTNNLTKMIDAANESRPYICMVWSAGDVAKTFNDEDDPEYAKRLRFAYASYLMAVKVVSAPKLPQDSTLSFGMPLLINPDNTISPDDGDSMPEMRSLPDLFFAQIGNAVTTNSLTGVYPNNGLKLGTTGDANHIYVRKFAKGFAAVYPWGSGSSVNITLPTRPGGTTHWENAYTGATVADNATPSLSPGDGLILVAK